MIKLPKDFNSVDYKFETAIPNAKLEAERAPDGSYIIRAWYEPNEIEEFAQEVAIEMTEKVEAAIMNELLKLNGYVPECTCQIKNRYCTNCNCEINNRAYFKKVVFDGGSWTNSCTANFCPNCGAKVVK